MDIFEQAVKEQKEVDNPVNQDLFERTANSPLIQKIQSNVSLAKDFNPDTEAKTIQIANKYNIPWSSVRGNEDKFEKAAMAPDPWKMVATHPKTASYYTDFDSTVTSFDDAVGLMNVEKAAKDTNPSLTLSRVFGRFWNDLKKSVSDRASGNIASGERFDPSNREDVLRYYHMLNSVEKAETYKLVSEYRKQGLSQEEAEAKGMTGRLGYHQKYWESVRDLPDLEIADEFKGKSSGFIEDVSGGIGGSLLGMVSVAANPVLGFADVFQQIYGATAEEFKISGVKPKLAAESAKASAIGQAPLEFAGNLIGLKFIKKAFKPGSTKEFLVTLLQSAVAEGMEEYTQTFPQEYARIMASKPGATQGDLISEFIDKVPDIATSDEAIYSASIGATIGAFFPLLGRTVGKTTSMVGKAIETKQFSDRFDTLQKAVEATKTKERAPEMTEKHLNALELGDAYLSAEGVTQLFQTSPEFAADILNRAGIDPKAAQAEAAQGNDVKTSLAKIHSRLTPEEQNQLKPDLKAAPSALTEREAKNIDVGKEAEKIGEQVKEYTEKQKSLQQVRNDLRGQIVKSGYSEKYANDAISLTEAFADRMTLDGLDKEQFLRKIAINTKATDAEGVAYNQIISDLPLSESNDYGNRFKTGVPVTFQYIKNTERSPYMGSTFQQDIEPAGKYMIIRPDTFKGLPNYEEGEVTFNNPLVIKFNKTGDALYDQGSWKKLLSEKFKATGKKLSKKITNAGYDGIVTVNDKGDTLEIVDLSSFIKTNVKNQSIFKSSQEIDKKWKEKGVEVFTFEKENKIYLESLIVPKEGRKQGVGTNVLNDLIEYADSVGKRIELTPGVKDSYQGTTSQSRLKKFYKRLGFVENKGRNKDFTTSKSMYRNPQNNQNILYQVTKKVKKFFQDKLGFYSSVEKSIDEMDFKTIPGKDLLNRLNKTSGLKKEELEWLGLPEFLELKDKVTKEEVQEFIKQGGVKLDEVVKGSPGFEGRSARMEILIDKENDGTITEEEKEELDAIEQQVSSGEETVDDTKFSKYALPGGENYREVLLTLPPNYEKEKIERDQLKNKKLGDILPSGETVTDRIDFLDTEIEQKKKAVSYRSSHYEEEGILAHFRLDDRIDSEGRKTLFIEEIQSDWHQEGRKKGYESERISEYEVKEDPINVGIFRVVKKGENGYQEISRTSGWLTKEDAQSAINSLEKLRGEKGVPDAPFKSSWPLLAFKRILRMAAEEGYDSVAWTPGEVQADRYDLSKQVDEIAYWLDDGESGGFIAKTTDGRDFEEQFSSPQELEGKLGKEVAQKILNREGVDGDERFEPGVRLLQNQDLKVGGEGMKAFYDKMLPSIVQNYIKKLDKSAKVDTSEIENKEVWSLPLTDKIKQKVLEGQALFQEQKRGSINITDDKYIISLFEGKNYSTLLHELGHVFLNEYSTLAANSPELQNDYVKLREWLGVEPGKEFEREHHEKFAQGFERYLAEGKAPTRELKSVFRRFKNWMLRVYQKATNIGIELDPEIRGIFDRMFTNRQDAYEAAQANNMEVWTKEEMDSLGVLPDDRKYMQSLYKAAIEKAEEEVTWRQNKDRANFDSKWKEEVKREVDSEPVYVSSKIIKSNGGFNLDAVKESFGDAYPEYIKKRLGDSAIKEKGGIDPIEVAVLSGFKTQVEMIRALMSADPIETAYAKELGKKQAENDARYQVEDYLTDSKEWEEFLRLKSSYLLKSEGSPYQVAPTEAFKKFAKEQLDNEKIADATASKRYLANASKYSREESRNLRSGKLAEASKASQIARLNFIKTNIAINNREFLNSARKGIRSLLKSKSITPDTSYQVQTLAARFGLVPLQKGEKINDALARITAGIPAEDRVAIYDWAQKKIDAGYEVQLPGFVLDGTVKDYRELTWAQFEDLKEAFDQIRTVDRQERYFTAFEKAQTMEEVRGNLLDQLYKSYKEKDISKRDESGVEKFLKGADAWTTKIETVLRMIDGGKINGAWWQYFFKPLQVAESKEADRLRQVIKDLRDLFKKTDISDSMFKKIFTEGMPRPLTKAQVLAVALNVGNKDNKTKLKDGWGWNDGELDAILDNLTKEDWDFVQGAWDYIDSFREESFSVAKEMTGLRPKRVEPVPVKTKYGEYKGGYYPLAYDPRKSLRTAENAVKKDLKSMFQKSHSAPNTKPSSHIERTKLAGGQKPILDLGVIPDHIFDVVHDITHRKAVVNIAKLARDKELGDAMVKTIGIDTSKQFMDWLTDISNDQNKPSSPLHKFASWARRGTTVVNMGMKMATLVQQFVGATQAIDEIGPKAFARGMNLFFGSGGLADLGKRGDFIRQRSGFMRNRLLRSDREIRDATKAITPVKNLQSDAMKGMFLGIGLAQWYGVDAPTWMGSYDKFVRENQGMSLSELEDKAVDYADSVVRQTQGSGATKDLSKIQRGDELMRMFTMFYSYFNVLYNLGKLRISQIGKGQRPAVSAIASIALLWFIPATLSELVSARGPDDDEDWIEWGLPLIAMYPFQSVVGVRDIASAIGSGYGYQLSPAESSVKNLVWLSKDIWDALAEGDTEDLGENIIENSGYLAPIPSKQLSIWLFNSYDLLTGEDDELNYKDFLRRNKK